MASPFPIGGGREKGGQTMRLMLYVPIALEEQVAKALVGNQIPAGVHWRNTHVLFFLRGHTLAEIVAVGRDLQAAGVDLGQIMVWSLPAE